MPYLNIETDYDKGYKVGKSEAEKFQNNLYSFINEQSKKDESPFPLGLDQKAIDRMLGLDSKQYQKGKKDGFSDGMGMPRELDLSDLNLYEQGYNAGKKDAQKDLFPGGSFAFEFVVD